MHFIARRADFAPRTNAIIWTRWKHLFYVDNNGEEYFHIIILEQEFVLIIMPHREGVKHGSAIKNRFLYVSKVSSCARIPMALW